MSCGFPLRAPGKLRLGRQSDNSSHEHQVRRMKIQSKELRSVSLQGALLIDVFDPDWIESLFLGIGSRPSWHELARRDPLRFSTSEFSPLQPGVAPEYSRDFGDSLVECTSGGDATVSILPHHKPSQRLHNPTAIGFAFAQQWARHGHACVHGALLKVEGKGVLVVGARAAGKSVLSASALAAGGGIVTDDHLLLGVKDDVVLGERIRRFLSLRRSWAADTLVEGFPDEWTPDRSGRRVFLRIDSDDERFPEFARIDRIWVLKRPRSGRQKHSSLTRINHAEVYAALVSAIQPLLLGADFPHERAKLQALLGKLMSSVPAARIETGQDIVLEPGRTWQRLLACAS